MQSRIDLQALCCADFGRTDEDGNPLLVNDVFRFVHDFFGQLVLKSSFDEPAECLLVLSMDLLEPNAWNVQS